MSKSLSFCVARASNPETSHYADRDWNSAKEIDAAQFFDQYIHGARKFTISGKDEDENEVSLTIELEFNPDAEFSYFTSKSCVHDGTLLFVYECMEMCMKNILCGATYDKRGSAPKNGDTISYVVGNFILLNEYGDSGRDFRPDAKSWMCQRTTCLLPIAMKA